MPGHYFLIGGAAKQTLDTFVRLAGGDRASILVVPQASEDPEGAGKDLTTKLNKAGAVKVVRRKFSIPRGTTAIYLAGGSQSKLVSFLGQAGIASLKRFFNAGGLIAGTSAGAMAFSEVMIADGMNDHIVQSDSLQLSAGIGLLPTGIVVDTHFSQRGRMCRAVAALASQSSVLCLDEDTAIYVANGRATVHGVGQVWLVTAQGSVQLDKNGVKGEDIRFSVWGPGNEFSFAA